jgi:site-specific recombinase XerD
LKFENILYLCNQKNIDNQQIKNLFGSCIQIGKQPQSMAKIENKIKKNPKLEQNKLSDGRISLYLEYYWGREEKPVLDKNGNQVYYESGAMAGKPKLQVKHNRRKENLSLYLLEKPRTATERQKNKETLELAVKIRAEREKEFKQSTLGYRLKKDRSVNFLDYFQSYIDSYTKKDIRMMKMALSRFKDFLQEKYPIYEFNIKAEQLNKEMMIAFVEYLQSRSVGEGAKGIYQRFKKVIKYAIENDVMIKNPCNGVQCKVDEQILRKDVLSLDEIQLLINCHYEHENPNVRRAFIFCLYCGLRFCDVKDLTFRNVDYSNRLLKFEQSKTKGSSASSGVVIPLNDGLLSLIGNPPENSNLDTLVFPLPSYESCCKSVKRWVKRAGINKHISWHVARHSFAVNILNNGANIKTVASLLGHSGLKHIEKYTRAVDKLKEDAINSLPKLKM